MNREEQTGHGRHPTATGVIARRASWLRSLCLVGLAVIASSCSSVRTIDVSSEPSGARVLIDGVDSGLTTPTQIELSTSEESYVIGVEKPGYNSVSREVVLSTDVDVMSAEEAFGRILCAPCCLGLTLPALLTPVDIEKSFQPNPLCFELDPEGQGVKLRIHPPDAEIYIDGRLRRPIDGHILVMDPGDHELEVTLPGYRPYTRVLYVSPQQYQDLEVQLEIEGQGFLIATAPGEAKLFIDDQYQGIIGSPMRRIRTEPGPHGVRIEREGYRTFEDILVVEPEVYREENIRLVLAGQGIILKTPRGYRTRDGDPQIAIGGALRATEFETPIRLDPGNVLLEITLPGHETWSTMIHVEADKYAELELDLKELRNPNRDRQP